MDLTKILDGTPEPSAVPLAEVPSYNNPKHEYNLPTPMADFQKELTDAIVSAHYSDILKYFETDHENDHVLIDSLQKLYLHVQLISVHPYLLITHFMPKSLVAKDIPMKLAQTSGKFRVLKWLVDIYSGVAEFRTLLRGEIHHSSENNKKYNQHVIQVVKGKLMKRRDVKKRVLVIARAEALDLVESLIIGLKVPYVKHSGTYLKNCTFDRQSYASRVSNYSVNTNTSLQNYLNPANFNLLPINDVAVHLLASNDLHPLDQGFDLVIPFDLSVDLDDPVLAQIRGSPVCPVLRLTPIYTVEHIALSFGNTNHVIDAKFRNTISAVVVERGKVGLVDSNLRSIYASQLVYLSDWLLGSSANWPLPAISTIPIYAPQDVEKSLLTEVKYAQEDDYSDFDEEAKSEKDDKLEFEAFGRFRDRFLKTTNDDFYESKRLTNHYLLNPLEDRSAIIGIEPSHAGRVQQYYQQLSRNLVLTHFEIYEVNLQYLKYQRIGADLRVSATLNGTHNQDTGNGLAEFQGFLQQYQELDEKHKRLVAQKAAIQSCLENLSEHLAKLSAAFDQMPTTGPDKYDQWRANQLQILKLEEEKAELARKNASKKNELSYLQIELDKLSTLDRENLTKIGAKRQLAERGAQQVQDFFAVYNDTKPVGKRQKMNQVISDVDELILGIKQAITVYEDLSNNRNRHRRK